MKRQLGRDIHSFRGITGKPRRGMALPHASYTSLVAEIRRCAASLQAISSESLTQTSAELKQRVAAGNRLTRAETVVQAFALVTEAMRRTTGMTYFDVQLKGGLVLAAGAIAEIQTGEGKTIITALPAFLQSLSGQAVHVATTNDYLSARDYEQLQPVYQLLGVSVRLLEPQSPPAQKRDAYASDVTYGPGYEFGFDFLRDQLTLRQRQDEPLGVQHLQRLRGHVLSRNQLVQRGRAFAIIDEADSVLIDEATTPLILSGVASAVDGDPAAYNYARDLVDQMVEHSDFLIDHTKRTVAFTASGWEAIHQALGNQPAKCLARPWSKYVENALRAKFLLKSDVHYVVREDQVMIVDQNTGRIHRERTWRAGLHQAVEVRESLEPSPEKETQGRVTRQRYCRLYSNISGLTGTARGSEDELRDFYNLAVVQIPTHRPCQRLMLPSRFFVSNSAKNAAIVKDVVRRQRLGQPVLIGTSTIQDSRALSAELQAAGARHVVLNGLQDATEASIVAQAGNAGAVTVATNMAGRGTDIRLAAAAIAAGGLHVLATQFHNSERVDRQLVGRSARQGDPGSCQFFASSEDDTLAHHGASVSAAIRSGADENGECRTDLTEKVRKMQSHLERKAFASRKRMVSHDQWLETVQWRSHGGPNERRQRQ